MSEEAHPAKILLVEDDPADREIVTRFLDESKFRNEVDTVSDGEEALDYLLGDSSDTDGNGHRPDLVLLDLNLPKLDGREILKRMNETTGLKEIPVVVLTTSDEEEDVHRSYGLGASSYITKPVDIEQFSEVIQSLSQYWLEIVVLPSESR